MAGLAVCVWPPLHWLTAAAKLGGFERAGQTRSSSSLMSRTQNPFHPRLHYSWATAREHCSPDSPAWQTRRVKWVCPLLVVSSSSRSSIYTSGNQESNHLSRKQFKMKMAESPLHKLLLSGWRRLHHFLLHLYNLHHKRVNQLEEGRKRSSRWSRRRGKK